MLFRRSEWRCVGLSLAVLEEYASRYHVGGLGVASEVQ